MKKAKQLHDQLEYDQVLPLVQEVLSREGVPIEQTLDAYVLEGSCLAIMGNPIDAEGPFRRLLRGRPDFELPVDTPPKIMSVFRKVQAEERAIAEQMEALTRKRIIEGMSLSGEVPQELKGGRPVPLEFVLKDPSAAAQTVRVQYRKKGESAYSSLALQNDGSGRWRASIPGEWTANDNGAELELFVEALDKNGPLLTQGSATAVLAAAGAGFGMGMSATQQAYDDQANLARSDPQPGSELRAKRELGETLGPTANSLFIASGVAAVATVVAGAFFTDWEGRGEQADDAAKPAPAGAAAR